MIRIDGEEAVLDRINSLQENNITDAIKEACLLVERDAKINCPVDDGQLRQSIKAEMIDDTSGKVGSNVEYAIYVHQGTGIYAKDGNGRKDKWTYQDAEGNWHQTIGQHPNPFLERALDDNRDRIIALIRDALGGGTR